MFGVCRSIGINALSGELPKELGLLTELKSLYVLITFFGPLIFMIYHWCMKSIFIISSAFIHLKGCSFPVLQWFWHKQFLWTSAFRAWKLNKNDPNVSYNALFCILKLLSCQILIVRVLHFKWEIFYLFMNIILYCVVLIYTSNTRPWNCISRSRKLSMMI